MSNYLQELEYQCLIFSSTSSNEQRKNAENVIQKYKKSYSIEAFTFVLNNTNNEILIYETLAAYSDTIINNWSQFVIEAQSNSNFSLTSYQGSIEMKPSEHLNQIILGLLDWVVKNQCRLSHSVWSQAIRTLSKLIRKTYAENMPIYFEQYMQKVNCNLLVDDLNHKIIGLDLIHGLLEVFSGLTVTNQQLKISRDSELKFRQDFEKKNLPEIFLLLMNLVNAYFSSMDLSTGQQAETFTNALFTNLEIIFSWNFLNKVQAIKIMLLPKNESSKRFCPPTKWSSIITDFSFVEFLFKVHDKIRSNPQLGLLSLSCLNQIAGLKVKFRHSLFLDSEQTPNCYRFSRIEFSFAFIDILCNYFDAEGKSNNFRWKITKELYDYEVPLLADIIYQLQEHLNSSVWIDGLTIEVNDKHIELSSEKNFPRMVASEYARHVIEKMGRFIKFYASFCVKCIDGAAAENISKSDTIFTETSERVLSRFVSFTNYQEFLQYTDKLSPTSSGPDFMSSSEWETLIFQELSRISQGCHRTLFQQFVNSHLAAPDGFRNVAECDTVIIESDDDDVDLDLEDDDKNAYEGGLYACGFSGLQCLPESLQYLSLLLHTRFLTLEKIVLNGEIPSFSLFEDLHWIVSVVGYVIFNITDDLIMQNRLIYAKHVDFSDLRLIYEHSRDQLKHMTLMELNKDEAMDRIIKHYQNLFINCAGEIERNLDRFAYSFDADLTYCDDIIRLFYLTLRGLSFCIRCCESGQLVADLVWLLNRWILGYLQLLNDSNNPELSDVTVLAIFVKYDSAKFSRQQILNSCMRLVHSCVEKWNQDPSVMKSVVNLMLNTTSSMSIARMLLLSDIWMNKMTKAIVSVTNPYNLLPEDTFSQFVTSVMNVAAACESEAQLNTYLQLLNPIGERLNNLFSSSDHSKVAESEVIICLSLIKGMVMTRWPSRLSKNSFQWSMGYGRLFDTLYPWLEKSVHLLFQRQYLYSSSIMQSLLECFLEISRSMLLELIKSQTTQFYILNLELFRYYSKKEFNSSVDGRMQKEETINEIRLIFTIASELLSKQVFDEFDLDEPGKNDELLGYDVISHLIYQLAPFISSDVLEVPEVGSFFFQCITLVTEFKASSFLLKMNYEFNSSLLNLLGQSVLNSNCAISSYSLRSINSLADEYFNLTIGEDAQMQFSLHQEFAVILTKIFTWIRSENVPSDMAECVSSALMSVVRLQKDQFLHMVSEWLTSLNNQFVTNKINGLLERIELSPSRGSQLSSLHRSNADKWNEFVQTVNSYGDL